MFDLIFFCPTSYLSSQVFIYMDARSEMNSTAMILFLIVCLFVFSGNLDKQTALGNTVLHYCSIYNKPECLKLLLRGKPTIDVGKFII